MLSCGHCYSPIGADEEWSPGIPPRVDNQQIAKMVEEIQESERAGEYIETAQWMREQVEHNGFMVCMPAMEAECPKCVYLRRIVEYRPIGRLSDESYRPPEREPKRQPTAEEIKAGKLAELAKVEASMKRMEAKAARLRRETQ
jgi:hypothetical protein